MSRYLLLLFLASTVFAAAPVPVHLSLNGKVGDFHSVAMVQNLPVLLVDGHAMVPIRFFDETQEIGQPLYTHLEAWKVYSVGDVGYKIGEPIAYRFVAMPGGGAAEHLPLPVPPQVFHGRLYLPAIAITFYGHAVAWDNATKTLLVVTKAKGK
jgi:hypothetical protein